MAKGYSVRYARNYTRRADGSWKLHSRSIWDEKGYTKTWPTIDAAEQAAMKFMGHITDPTAACFIPYCKIYYGKDCVKIVDCSIYR